MKQNKQQCDLHSCFFCRHLLAEWRPLLQLNRKTYLLKKGELLFEEGAEVKGIYFLEQGKIKVHQKWTEDKELIIRFAGAGAMVGHRGLGGDLHYPVSATALEACSVCFVELDFFQATLRTNPDLTQRLLDFFAEELRESELRMRNMARLTVKSRVATALLFLEEKFGSNSDGMLGFHLSRQDLAAYVGATYETVFRVLQELSEAGMVRWVAKELGITDKTGLALVAMPDREGG